MKTKILIGFLSLILINLMVINYQHWVNSSKVVYIDSSRLMEEYQGMLDARSEFNQKTMEWQANIDTLTKEVQVAMQDFESGRSNMTAKERELSKKLVETKRKQLNQYRQAIELQYQQEDQRMMQEVLADVNAKINDYGKKHGYQFILGANSSGSLVYAADERDKTDELIALLNNSYEGP